jgi:hypothetical protein
MSILTFVSSLVLHCLKGIFTGSSLSIDGGFAADFTAAAVAIYRIIMQSHTCNQSFSCSNAPYKQVELLLFQWAYIYVVAA